MPFTFDNIVTPQGKKLQRVFADLQVQMTSLADSAPEDHIELAKEKEDWCLSWERVMRELDQCTIDGKTYGLSFPLGSDEAAKGHKEPKPRAALSSAEEDRRREESQARDKDVRMSAGADDERTGEEEEEDGEDEEEEEPPKHASPKKAAAPAKWKTPRMSTALMLVIHKDRCERCIKQDVRCQGPEGMGCQNCRSARQGCKHATRKGKGRVMKPLPRPKARTTSTAESMPIPGPSKEVLIRRPCDTIEVSDEEDAADTRSAVNKKRREMEALGDVEDVDAEDLEIEALTRSVYAQMATIQAMMGKVLNDVDLLNLRNKKRRRRG
ncbi:hypothetical protein EV424DRAFT_1533449 [Suillus variegatus]|nr:hypothetical protein EV424DRAFT_1533449 [Suillus variegatus]